MTDSIFFVQQFEPHSVELKLTSRIKTAIDMLDITSKFHTEQETDGVFDTFREQLRGALRPYDVIFTICPEYFKGVDDVILEININIIEVNNRASNVPLDSEQITGTLLNSLFHHLELNSSRYSYRNVVLFENWKSQDIKALTIFGNKRDFN